MVRNNRSSGVKSAEEPQDLHKLFEQALNSGDLDALVALYAPDGLLMARSERARGIGAIRKALADYVAMKPTIQLTTAESCNRRTPRCLWQIGDSTEPLAMAAVCPRRAPVSKSLAANRTGVGATSSTSPTESVNRRSRRKQTKLPHHSRIIPIRKVLSDLAIEQRASFAIVISGSTVLF
jgi:hypothetical protein